MRRSSSWSLLGNQRFGSEMRPPRVTLEHGVSGRCTPVRQSADAARKLSWSRRKLPYVPASVKGNIVNTNVYKDESKIPLRSESAENRRAFNLEFLNPEVLKLLNEGGCGEA